MSLSGAIEAWLKAKEDAERKRQEEREALTAGCSSPEARQARVAVRRLDGARLKAEGILRSVFVAMARRILWSGPCGGSTAEDLGQELAEKFFASIEPGYAADKASAERARILAAVSWQTLKNSFINLLRHAGKRQNLWKPWPPGKDGEPMEPIDEDAEVRMEGRLAHLQGFQKAILEPLESLVQVLGIRTRTKDLDSKCQAFLAIAVQEKSYAEFLESPPEGTIYSEKDYNEATLQQHLHRFRDMAQNAVEERWIDEPHHNAVVRLLAATRDEGGATRSRMASRRSKRMRSVMWTAIGQASQQQVQQAREAVQEDPGCHAVAHREAWADRCSVCLPLEDHEGELRPRKALFAEPGSVASLPVGRCEALPRSEVGDQPAGSETLSQTFSPRSWSSEEEEGLALDALCLDLADARVDIFGDQGGMWCRMRSPDGSTRARAVSSSGRATGWHAQLPVTTDPPGVTRLIARFRPGPLRRHLRTTGPGIDRAYSPLAFVVTVGESSLRNLLGWFLKSPTEELGLAARQAGVPDRDELLRLMKKENPLDAGWIAELPLAESASNQTGSATLGELLDLPELHLLPPELLGAEVDTLLALQDVLAPSDGDTFLLVATDTATSLLAAQIIGAFLRACFPASRLALEISDAMRQDRNLAAKRSLVSSEPARAVYQTVAAQVGTLLTEEAADPVLVASGGTKWQAAALLCVAHDRRIAYVYKFLGGQPWVFRFDRYPAGEGPGSLSPHHAQQLEREAPKPEALGLAGPAAKQEQARLGVAVLNVGISLLHVYREERGDRQAVPTAEELLKWVRKRVANGKEAWRLSAELGGVEAWIQRRCSAFSVNEMAVALVCSRSSKKPDPGQVCADVLESLLQDRNLVVRRSESWDVPDLGRPSGRSGTDDTHEVFERICKPIRLCIEQNQTRQGPPDVLFGGGQKLTASLLQLVAMAQGCRVWYVPDAREGHRPGLWTILEPAEPEPRLLEAVAPTG